MSGRGRQQCLNAGHRATGGCCSPPGAFAERPLRGELPEAGGRVVAAAGLPGYDARLSLLLALGLDGGRDRGPRCPLLGTVGSLGRDAQGDREGAALADGALDLDGRPWRRRSHGRSPGRGRSRRRCGRARRRRGRSARRHGRISPGGCRSRCRRRRGRRCRGHRRAGRSRRCRRSGCRRSHYG